MYIYQNVGHIALTFILSFTKKCLILQMFTGNYSFIFNSTLIFDI